MKKEQIKNLIKKFNPKNVLYSTWFGISNPWGSSSFTTVDGSVSKAKTLINFFVNISALVAVIVIVYGAVLLLTAAGREDRIEKGMDTIQAGIVGMVIVFLAGVGINYLVTAILKI